MYKTPSGKEIFVIDGHTHFWDGSPENQRNVHGQQFIDCFYSFHIGMSPPEERWTHSRFAKFSEDDYYGEVFADGAADMAIIQSTYLTDFYKTGFSKIERSHAMAARHPERFILTGTFDPRDGEKALEYIHWLHENYNVKGMKLYNAEWNGDSKGWSLKDPSAYKCFELCDKLGIRNMHVHKGPTILPLSKDAFDVHDVDYAATDFQNLNWIVEHAGLPRLDDFCWIATQETNVYAGLAVVMSFLHTRPRYFGEIMTELLSWIGEDKLMFGSDFALWKPKSLVEKFMNFQIADEIAQERGVQLTDAIKEKILGLNLARLYNINVEEKMQQLAGAPVQIAAE